MPPGWSHSKSQPLPQVLELHIQWSHLLSNESEQVGMKGGAEGGWERVGSRREGRVGGRDGSEREEI